MPENDGRHHDNSITALKEQESQERGNGDADRKKRGEKKGEKRRKGACREQGMLGKMRADEEERHDGTGEYTTQTQKKGEEVWNNPN